MICPVILKSASTGKLTYNILRARKYLPPIGKASYKKIPDEDTLVRDDITFVPEFPKSNTISSLYNLIDEAIESGKHQIAFRGSDVSVKDFLNIGFKKTVGLPAPGENVWKPSWRFGKLHVRKVGDMFLMHKDAHVPDNPISFVTHNATDVPKGIYNLWIKNLEEVK